MIWLVSVYFRLHGLVARTLCMHSEGWCACANFFKVLTSLCKAAIFHKDERSLMLKGASDNHSANFVTRVAESVSWRNLWDRTLDHGSRSTEQLQRIIFHSARPVYSDLCCKICSQSVKNDTSWLSHLCLKHNVTINSKSLTVTDILNLLTGEGDELFYIIFP